MAENAKAEQDRYDNIKKIGGIYKAPTKSQTAFSGGYDDAYEEYGTHSAEAQAAYESMAREARVNKALLERAGREKDRAAGITSKAAALTIGQRSENNLRNTLGSAARQYEKYKGNVEHALNNLKIQEAADKKSAAARMESEKSANRLSKRRADAEFGLQRNYLDLKKSESDFNKAYQLFMSRMIKKGKFKDITGIKVRNLPMPKPKNIFADPNLKNSGSVPMPGANATNAPTDKDRLNYLKANKDELIKKYGKGQYETALVYFGMKSADIGRGGVSDSMTKLNMLVNSAGTKNAPSYHRFYDEFSKLFGAAGKEVYGTPAYITSGTDPNSFNKKDYIEKPFSLNDTSLGKYYVSVKLNNALNAKGIDPYDKYTHELKSEGRLMLEYLGISTGTDIDFNNVSKMIGKNQEEIISLFGLNNYSSIKALTDMKTWYSTYDNTGMCPSLDKLENLMIYSIGDIDELHNLFQDAESEMDNLNTRLNDIYNSGNAYSCEGLTEYYPELKNSLVYDETNEEDSLRKKIGITPKGFDADAFVHRLDMPEWYQMPQELTAQTLTDVINTNLKHKHIKGILGEGYDDNGQWAGRFPTDEEITGELKATGQREAQNTKKTITDEQALMVGTLKNYIENTSNDEKLKQAAISERGEAFAEACAKKPFPPEINGDTVSTMMVDRDTFDPIHNPGSNPNWFDITFDLSTGLIKELPGLENTRNNNIIRDANETITKLMLNKSMGLEPDAQLLKQVVDVFPDFQAFYDTVQPGSYFAMTDDAKNTLIDSLVQTYATKAHIDAEEKILSDAASTAHNDPDFAKYVAIGMQYHDGGRDNARLLNMINNTETPEFLAMKRQLMYGGGGNPVGPMMAEAMDDRWKYEKYLKPEEKDVINYLYGKGDDKGLQSYLDSIERTLNLRVKEAEDATIAKMSKLEAGIYSIITAPTQVFSLVESGIQSLGNAIRGEWEPADPNTVLFRVGSTTSRLREHALEGTEGIGRTLAELGFSAADMAVLLPLGPGAMPVVMSSEAGGAMANDIISRGGSPEQALLGGTLAALTEYFTEKVPLKKLFGFKDAAGKLTRQQFIKEIGKQIALEGSEELLSGIENTLQDIAIMGEKSTFALRVKDLMDSGLSESAATAHVWGETLLDWAMQFGSGGLLGGTFAGGFYGLGTYQNYRAAKNVESDIRTNIQQNVKAPVSSMENILPQTIDLNAITTPEVQNSINNTAQEIQSLSEKVSIDLFNDDVKNAYYQFGLNPTNGNAVLMYSASILSIDSVITQQQAGTSKLTEQQIGKITEQRDKVQGRLNELTAGNGIQGKVNRTQQVTSQIEQIISALQSLTPDVKEHIGYDAIFSAVLSAQMNGGNAELAQAALGKAQTGVKAALATDGIDTETRKTLDGLLDNIDSREILGDNKRQKADKLKVQIMKKLVDTKGLRNDLPLTQEQINEVVEYAKKLGFPEDKIFIADKVNSSNTGLLGGEILIINNDVFPSLVIVYGPNSLISARGAIAHEVIGHYETILKKTAFDQYDIINNAPVPNLKNIALDEAQASIRAARFAPDLTLNERYMLIRDAITRLKTIGLRILDIKNLLDIYER